VNQWLKSRNRCAGSNLVDLGRCAALVPLCLRGDVSDAGYGGRSGGRDEGLRRSRGDAAGIELGTALVERSCGERGNRPRSPLVRAAGPRRGQVCCRLVAVGRGGGPVVVRGRESRSHGEGGQQVSSADAGIPGGRW
jgi:hypothetical protein